jgi:hypothetical protein
MISDQPSKAAKVFKFICGLVCAVMFALPICGIIAHACLVNQAEREWKEQLKKQSDETNKLIRSYNEAVEKSRRERL